MNPWSISELERIWLCGTCVGLNGVPTPLYRPQKGGQQSCPCRRTDEPTWSGSDFNEHVHLCECCLQEALPSGGKFCVWFCNRCKELVTRFNDERRVWLIPIGRHSFMVRTYDPPGHLMLPGSVVSLDETGRTAAIARFADGFLGMASSMDRLHEWSKARLRSNLLDLGFPAGADVRLPAYLKAARARAAEDRLHSREIAFRRLRDHMLGR